VWRVAKVNRDSAVPLPEQVTALMRADIAAGVLRGRQHEEELRRRYGVSRATLRLGMRPLAEEGLITAVQGRGTFIVPQEGRPG
jgi:GntR family transcriptional regulator